MAGERNAGIECSRARSAWGSILRIFLGTLAATLVWPIWWEDDDFSRPVAFGFTYAVVFPGALLGFFFTSFLQWIHGRPFTGRIAVFLCDLCIAAFPCLPLYLIGGRWDGVLAWCIAFPFPFAILLVAIVGQRYLSGIAVR